MRASSEATPQCEHVVGAAEAPPTRFWACALARRPFRALRIRQGSRHGRVPPRLAIVGPSARRCDRRLRAQRRLSRWQKQDGARGSGSGTPETFVASHSSASAAMRIIFSLVSGRPRACGGRLLQADEPLKSVGGGPRIVNRQAVGGAAGVTRRVRGRATDARSSRVRRAPSCVSWRASGGRAVAHERERAGSWSAGRVGPHAASGVLWPRRGWWSVGAHIVWQDGLRSVGGAHLGAAELRGGGSVAKEPVRPRRHCRIFSIHWW